MERKFGGRALGLAVGACAVLGAVRAASADVMIETVAVGNAGNAADPATGNLYGAVNYNYNIGKYEVTAGQYTAFLNKVAATADTYALYNSGMANTAYGSGIAQNVVSGGFTYTVDPAFINRPVNYVSFWDATRFANWLNNGQGGAGTTETGAYTLTTSGITNNTVTRNAGATWAVTSEDEWYKAAYYNPAASSYYLYPTGSDTVPGRDLADASGNNANYYGNPYPIQSPYSTTVAGEFQNSASPYGTFDQGGNVWEWNEAILSGSSRGIRGGSFISGGNLQSAIRIDGDPTNENYDFGFRVSLVPEPTSLALLGVGTVGMMIRRRGARR